MFSAVYYIIGLVMLVVPLVAAVKRYWAACAIYLVADAIYLYGMTQDRGGWERLAEAALLVAVVVPLFAVASLVWLVTFLLRRRRRL